MKNSIQEIMFFIITILLSYTNSLEEGYLRYVKEGCFQRNEALSCLKYKGLKVGIKTFFGDNYGNETFKANRFVSIVPLDDETVKILSLDKEDKSIEEPKSFLSEWTELTKYIMKLVKDFFKLKGVKVNLPEGARMVEEEDEEDDDEKTHFPARGRKKKLAIVVPLLTLLAAMKTKLLLVPVLLGVMLIKKVLIAAAFLLPSFLSTLKNCKHQHYPHYSYLGSESDFNSDYGNSYSYSSGGGYAKDWASNRAYSPTKHRVNAPQMYITAPGPAAS